MEAFVTSKNENGLLTITFFHPSHNSLPGNILKSLAEAIQLGGEDENVKLILVKSGGERTFCAGASFDELVAIENENQGESFFMGFANVINTIRTCPKLVLGRVQGKAVGGGVGLACAFDYCFATKYASIRLSELAVGIGPFVIGPAVERKCGLSAFSKMALTPNIWQDAQYAKHVGIYQDVFESAQELDEHIAQFSESLLNMNPEAIAGLKKVFWDGTDHWDTLLNERAKQSGRLVLSEYSKKTIASFLNK